MNAILDRARDLAWWVASLAALLLVVGVEVDWAHQVGPTALAAGAVSAPKPVDPTLLPEYAIPGGVESRTETVNRTLFNPTRRPAPTPASPEAPKPQMARGQFALAGTTVVDGKSTAFLREVKTGKFRRVHQGDTIDGMLVTEVKPDRVKLAMGGDTEELVLKVAANPRPTPALPAPMAAMPGQPPFVQPGQTPEQAAQLLLQRRRAARAAAAARNANENPLVHLPAAPATSNPAPVINGSAARAATPTVAAPRASPPAPGQPTTWADVFNRYQQQAPAGAAGR